MTEDQRTNQVTVLCAWCGALLREGGPEISHGICRDCAPALLEKIRERLKERRREEAEAARFKPTRDAS